jgi:hypothetical protein
MPHRRQGPDIRRGAEGFMDRPQDFVLHIVFHSFGGLAGNHDVLLALMEVLARSVSR